MFTSHECVELVYIRCAKMLNIKFDKMRISPIRRNEYVILEEMNIACLA